MPLILFEPCLRDIEPHEWCQLVSASPVDCNGRSLRETCINSERARSEVGSICVLLLSPSYLSVRYDPFKDLFKKLRCFDTISMYANWSAGVQAVHAC